MILRGSKGDFLKRVDDRYDKHVFFSVFFIGTVAIVLLRLVGAHPVLVLAPPILLLLGYAAYVMGTSRMSVSLDRAGDNLYYLGLLFTLISLSASLVQVFSLAESAEAIFDLLSAFGVALASTILGMFLRIFVQQFRHDPVDVEREVRSDLQEAARTVRDQLYAMTADFNTYRRAVHQSLEELQAELVTSLGSMSEQASASISETSKGLTTTTGRLTKLGGKQGDALEAVVAQFQSAMDALFSKIDSIEIDTGVVSSRFDKAATAFDTIAGQMVQRAQAEEDAVRELKSLVGVVGELSTDAVRNDLRHAATDLGTVTQGLRSVVESFSDLNLNMGISSENFARAQRDHIEALGGLSEKMQSAVSQAVESSARMQTGLVSVVKDLRSEIER